MPKSERRALIGLHLLLAVYSLSDVCSKTAAGAPFMSFRFLFFYGCVLGLLGVYAIGWQQVIRRLPLTVAFANRAVTVVWGIVWGVLFFREQVSPLRLVGAALIMAGVVLFARADGRQAEEERKDG
ncbi:MAG: EamA family transporter [Bacteroidales bacterium]|mgnify:FL=1|jgi:drug/metabolite transporter (DMT)-like permease|nr:EamA family transporter [Bacteroidales bacterium]